MNDLWSHNTERRIYVDCDGVLADFDTHFEDHIGLKSSHYESTHGSKRFWKPFSMSLISSSIISRRCPMQSS